MEAGLMMEDLLNFTLDVHDDDYDDKALVRKTPLFSLSESSDPNNSSTQDPDEQGGFPLPEFAEEELEWLNADAFPEVETCLDILSDNPAIGLDHQSPVSVLDNGTSNRNNTISCNGGILVPLRHPVKARSKLTRPRRGSGFLELPNPLCRRRSQGSVKNPKQEFAAAAAPQPRPPTQGATTIGRRCQHCQAEKTPQWRAGPMGPKTLCNACGVRFKSGRLVPEYRPANSPTFSRLLHSNSHRQVMEMRRQKQLGEGMVFNEACGYKL